MSEPTKRRRIFKNPRMSWFTHHAEQLQLVAFTYLMFGGFIPIPKDWYWQPLNYLSSVLIGVFYALDHRHTSGICLRCGENFPLDPGAEAEKKLRSLQFFHRVWRPEGRGSNYTLLTRYGVFFGVFGIALAMQMARIFSSTVGAVIILTTLWLWLVGFGFLGIRHRRLQPWCPFCKRPDGGGDHHGQVPDDPGGLGLDVPKVPQDA